MKKTYHNRVVASSIMALLLVGCALPMASTPTQFVFPTPNLTMTALFQIPPTNTSAPQPSVTPGVPTSSIPSATLSPTAPNCTNQAQFVSETFADLTYVAPGTAFTKTWTLKNAGTCTWGAGYSLVFDSGDQMGGPASVPITASVPPSAVYNFTVNLTAPATLGQYQGFWKIQTPQGVRFGTGAENKAFWVKITTAVLAPSCAAQTKRPDSYGGVIEAYYTGTPPTIDAVLTDWDSPLINDVPHDVWGDTNNDARFTLKWDSGYLYLAIKVVDDNFYQSTDGRETMYKGDSVEILLDKDLKGDYCSTSLSGDDYQLGISPGDLVGTQGPTAWLWYPLDKKGEKIVSIASIMTIAPDTNGYIIEARLPWSIFGGAPAGSEYYGFALSVSDNDHSGQQQEGLISTAPKRTIFSNPMLWGTLQIEIQTGP